ncbi:MAG TPA: glycoside hydrolase family 88 protein [Candidatus Cryptobacteroides intestinipullorum]|nr:glycoside hydrolase family 88 protein [Candidatus Cryptobacteroides intestinipullorum]
MKLKFLSILALAAFAVQCAPQTDIISENVDNAKIQLKYLLEASEAGDTVRIPSTYQNGEIVYVPVDDWVSGFFAGTLWYMYELTGDEYWADHARKHTEILDTIQYLKWHHDIGFMIYDSYGNGLRLKNPDGYKDVIVNAAKSLSTRFRPAAGIIQSWDADKGWQANNGWKCPVIIDNMMNLELLMKATEFTGDSTYYNIAVSHADQTMKNHYRPDYSTYHVVDYDPETGEVRGRYTAQGYSDESAWARGQAWSLYGYTVMYRYTGDKKYLEQAEKVADFILNHPNMPEDLIPYWDFDCPDIPDTYRDVSAGAIMASALYELFGFTGNDMYKEKADKMIESLSSPAYRAAQGTNGGFILMHSVGSIPHGSSIDVPLNYADYYFLEALIRKGNLEKGLAPVKY